MGLVLKVHVEFLRALLYVHVLWVILLLFDSPFQCRSGKLFDIQLAGRDPNCGFCSLIRLGRQALTELTVREDGRTCCLLLASSTGPIV
jgi:hypothetical protein